jgi:hypothetical protein
LDNDPLQYRIVALPAAGALYQTTDGVTPGTAITNTPKLVTDPQHRVLFVPAAGQSGAPYASLQFVAADERSTSAPATIGLTVTPYPSLSITPAGGSFSGPVTVSFSSTDASASIRFTTNGSAAGPASQLVPAGGSLVLDRSLTLRAIAISGTAQSPEQSLFFSVADADSDGLPDWWENQHSGDLHPGVDSDGNGLTAAEEFAAGIAPGAAGGFQGQLQVSVDLNFQWQSVVGRMYQVEAADDAKTWQSVGGLQWGTGGTMTWMEVATAQPRFFRVRVTLP